MAKVKVHPLLLPEVLETVSQFCTFTDLKSIRGVCRQWNRSSFLEFCSRSRLQFENYDGMKEFMKMLNTKEMECNYSETLGTKEREILLYKRLSSNVRLFGLEFQSHPLLLRPFLQDSGKFLKILEIDHGIATHSPSGIGEFLREFKRMELPQLDTLILSGSHLTNDPRDRFRHSPDIITTIKTLKVLLTIPKGTETGYRFFQELLRSFPNLESITCINYQLLSLFSIRGNHIILPSQKVAKLHVHVWNAVGIPEFISYGYSLKTLKLKVAVTISRKNLHDLILSQSATLEHLEIHFPTDNARGQHSYNYAHNATSFPSAPDMTMLKYLKLIGFWGNLYFAKDIPKLQKMDVECMLPIIAFPDGTQNETLMPKRIRKIIRFWDQNGIFYDVSDICFDTM